MTALLLRCNPRRARIRLYISPSPAFLKDAAACSSAAGPCATSACLSTSYQHLPLHQNAQNSGVGTRLVRLPSTRNCATLPPRYPYTVLDSMLKNFSKKLHFAIQF